MHIQRNSVEGLLGAEDLDGIADRDGGHAGFRWEACRALCHERAQDETTALAPSVSTAERPCRKRPVSWTGRMAADHPFLRHYKQRPRQRGRIHILQKVRRIGARGIKAGYVPGTVKASHQPKVILHPGRGRHRHLEDGNGARLMIEREADGWHRSRPQHGEAFRPAWSGRPLGRGAAVPAPLPPASVAPARAVRVGDAVPDRRKLRPHEKCEHQHAAGQSPGIGSRRTRRLREGRRDGCRFSHATGRVRRFSACRDERKGLCQAFGDRRRLFRHITLLGRCFVGNFGRCSHI